MKVQQHGSGFRVATFFLLLTMSLLLVSVLAAEDDVVGSMTSNASESASTVAVGLTSVGTSSSSSSVEGTPAGTSKPTTNKKNNRKYIVAIVDLNLLGLPKDSALTTLNAFVNNVMPDRMGTDGDDVPLSTRELELALVDSKGEILHALFGLHSLVGGGSGEEALDSVIVADTLEVTIAVANALQKSAPKVTMISAFASSAFLCDGKVNPNVLCVVPTDELNVKVLNQVASEALKWKSVATVFSEGSYGASMFGLLQPTSTPYRGGSANANQLSVVASTYVVPFTTPEADDDLLRKLLEYKPVGILAFVTPAEMLRLRAAQSRLRIDTTELSFLLSKTGLSLLPTMTGSFTPLWGQVLAPSFAPKEWFVQKNYVSKGDSFNFTQYGAFVLSYMHDSMMMLNTVDPSSASVTPAKQMTATTIEVGALTGVLSFDSLTNLRSAASFSLMSASFQDHPLVSWFQRSLTSAPEMIVAETTIKRIIPPSPLQAVTVCVTAAPDVSDLVGAIYQLQLIQRENNRIRALKNAAKNGDTNSAASSVEVGETGLATEATSLVMMIPVVINTGLNGVDGLTNLVGAAPTCSFVTGPGRSNVNFALAPVLNHYRIPQIDTATNTAFSNKRRFPFYSRVNPSDVFFAKTMSEVTKYFDWERIITIGTNDENGRNIQDNVGKEMDERTVMIEQVYSIDPLYVVNPQELEDSLVDIRENGIARIVMVLLPATTPDEASVFYEMVVRLGMDKSHIFLLGDQLCRAAVSSTSYASSYLKAMRVPLVSSICAEPFYGQAPMRRFREAGGALMDEKIQRVLFKAGFDTREVAALTNSTDVTDEELHTRLSPFDSSASYAIDGTVLILNVIARAKAVGISFSNSTALSNLIRSANVNGMTGKFSLDANGDRTSGAYRMNIQRWNGTVMRFGFWDSEDEKSVLGKSFTPDNNAIKSILWLDNSTDVPPATTRSLGFIAAKTIQMHPGTIALSVLGFLVTIAVFVFCYRHYSLQRKLEKTVGVDLAESGSGVRIVDGDGDSLNRSQDNSKTFRRPSDRELREIV